MAKRKLNDATNPFPHLIPPKGGENVLASATAGFPSLALIRIDVPHQLAEMLQRGFGPVVPGKLGIQPGRLLRDRDDRVIHDVGVVFIYKGGLLTKIVEMTCRS